MTHIVAGGVAGGLAAAVTTPLDVAKVCDISLMVIVGVGLGAFADKHSRSERYRKNERASERAIQAQLEAQVRRQRSLLSNAWQGRNRHSDKSGKDGWRVCFRESDVRGDDCGNARERRIIARLAPDSVRALPKGRGHSKEGGAGIREDRVCGPHSWRIRAGLCQRRAESVSSQP
jgi:hypothetical protein